MELENVARLRTVVVHRLSNTRYVVSGRLSSRSIVVSAGELTALQTLETARRLSDHAFRLKELFGSDEDGRRLLQRLCEAELLISPQMVEGNVEETERHRISSICIPTKNRPAALRRCIASIAENLAEYQRCLPIKVADLTPDPHIAGLNEAACLEVGNGEGGVFYRNQASLRVLAGELSKAAGVDPLVLEFLFGLNCSSQRQMQIGSLATHGGGRNVALVESVGKLMITCDDDTVCRFYTRDVNRADFTVRSDPLPFDWLPDQAAETTPSRQDLVGAHEEFLGRSFRSAFGDIDESAFSRLPLSALEQWGERQAAIDRSFFGTNGDSGFHSMLRLILWGGQRFTGVMSSAKSYADSCSSRRGARCVDRAVITASPFCMAINCGLDNRSLLPPFMPFQRNEDGLFGCLLYCTKPGSLALFMPALVSHEPVEIRTSNLEAEWAEMLGWRSCDYLTEIMVVVAGMGGSWRPTVSLRGVGEDLIDIGRMTDRAFEGLLGEIRTGKIIRVLQQLEVELSNDDVPEFLRKDLVRFRDALLETFSRRVSVGISDLPGAAVERVFIFRELVLSYGLLLRHWEGIRGAACQMNFEHPEASRCSR